MMKLIGSPYGCIPYEDIADRIIFYKSCYKMVLSIGIPGIQSSDL